MEPSYLNGAGAIMLGLARRGFASLAGRVGSEVGLVANHFRISSSFGPEERGLLLRLLDEASEAIRERPLDHAEEVMRIEREHEAACDRLAAAAEGFLQDKKMSAGDLVMVASRALVANQQRGRLIEIIRETEYRLKNDLNTLSRFFGFGDWLGVKDFTWRLDRILKEKSEAVLKLEKRIADDRAHEDKERAHRGAKVHQLWKALGKIPDRTLRGNVWDEAIDALAMLDRERGELRHEVAKLRERLSSANEPLPDSELAEIQGRADASVDLELSGIPDNALRELVRHALGDRRMLLQELRRRARAVSSICDECQRDVCDFGCPRRRRVEAENEASVETGYTRKELSSAIDSAHARLHEATGQMHQAERSAAAAGPGAMVTHAHIALAQATVSLAHDDLHNAGAGTVRTGCATRDPESQRLAGELLAKLEGTGLPCGHRLADLVWAPGSVTKCGACQLERVKES